MGTCCSNEKPLESVDVVCSKCKSNEVVYNKMLSKIKTEYFCSSCFKEYVEQKMFSCIEESNLIADGDIIGVGTSGGKDSQFLLHVLLKYRKIRNFQLKCFMVDEGISNYREFGIDIAKKYCETNNLPLFVSTMKSEYGYRVDEFVQKYSERNNNEHFRVCSICDPTRINIVKKLAAKESCNKLALGINLDDHIITFFVSMQSSNIEDRLFTISPKYQIPKTNFDFEYILPTSLVTDKEISLYNILEKIPYQTEPSCPYADTCLDGSYRNLIYSLEDMAPGYRSKAWNNIQLFNKGISVNTEVWGKCEMCGEGFQSNGAKICLDCERYSKLKEKAGL